MWGKRILACSKARREGSLLVLIALGEAAWNTDLATISVPDLARLCRLKDRQVQYALAELLAIGEIEIAQAGGGRGNPTTYRIRLEWTKGVRFTARKRNPKRARKPVAQRVHSAKGV